MIWPRTADELKMDVTTMAVNGVDSAVVKEVMYSDTGKYESPWRRSVRD